MKERKWQKRKGFIQRSLLHCYWMRWRNIRVDVLETFMCLVKTWRVAVLPVERAAVFTHHLPHKCFWFSVELDFFSSDVLLEVCACKWKWWTSLISFSLLFHSFITVILPWSIYFGLCCQMCCIALLSLIIKTCVIFSVYDSEHHMFDCFAWGVFSFFHTFTNYTCNIWITMAAKYRTFVF